MKKLLIVLLTLLIAVCTVFTACSPKAEDGNKEQEQGQEQEPEEPEEQTVTPTVTLPEHEVTVYVGNTYELPATVTNNVDNVPIAYKSDNSEIATYIKGVITGKSEGITTVTASLRTGEKDTCKVTVIKHDDKSEYNTDKTSVWDGTYPTSQPSTYIVDVENGTLDITDAGAFAYLRTVLENTSALTVLPFKMVYLDCDIDMNGKAWSPINDRYNRLNDCTFNFQDHTIKNLSFADQVGTSEKAPTPNSLGLFGYTKGGFTINDLTISGVNTTNGAQWIGVLIGAIEKAGENSYGTYEPSETIINNVTIENCSVKGTVKGKNGLLVGFLHDALTLKVNDVNIKNSKILAVDSAGGLLGSNVGGTMYATNVKVSGCEICQTANYDHYGVFDGYNTYTDNMDYYTNCTVENTYCYYGSGSSFTTDLGSFENKVDGESALVNGSTGNTNCQFMD